MGLRVVLSARLDLPLAALEVLAKLCGQYLVAQGGLFDFAHGARGIAVAPRAGDRRFLALRRAGPYGKGAPVAPGTLAAQRQAAVAQW